VSTVRLVALDLVVAGAVALLVFQVFGATGGSDVNPPECTNAAGGVVSCSLTAPVLMLPAFGLTLLLLAVGQLRRRAARTGTPR
jgi:hypothetical protein